MKRTLLITGGTGFLGRHLLRKLAEQKYDLILLQRSCSDLQHIHDLTPHLKIFNSEKTDLNLIFNTCHVDIIIHCATNYGRQNKEDLAQLIQTNLVLPINLLQCAAKYNVSTFINTDTTLTRNVSPYALSKKQFLEWFKNYSDKLLCINVAIEHFYGPSDDKNKFLSSIIHQLLLGTPQINLTLGEQKRDFIYIDDVINAFLCIMTHLKTQHHGFLEFEIGSGETIKIRDIVEKIVHMIGNKTTYLNFGALPYRTSEIMESKIDLSAISKLDWQPKVTLTEGLTKTIQYERGKLNI